MLRENTSSKTSFTKWKTTSSSLEPPIFLGRSSANYSMSWCMTPHPSKESKFLRCTKNSTMTPKRGTDTTPKESKRNTNTSLKTPGCYGGQGTRDPKWINNNNRFILRDTHYILRQFPPDPFSPNLLSSQFYLMYLYCWGSSSRCAGLSLTQLAVLKKWCGHALWWYLQSLSLL